jgi:hypothetical protein
MVLKHIVRDWHGWHKSLAFIQVGKGHERQTTHIFECVIEPNMRKVLLVDFEVRSIGEGYELAQSKGYGDSVDKQSWNTAKEGLELLGLFVIKLDLWAITIKAPDEVKEPVFHAF